MFAFQHIKADVSPRWLYQQHGPRTQKGDMLGTATNRLKLCLCQALAEMLTANTAVKCLSLGSTGISDEGAQAWWGL